MSFKIAFVTETLPKIRLLTPRKSHPPRIFTYWNHPGIKSMELTTQNMQCNLKQTLSCGSTYA